MSAQRLFRERLARIGPLALLALATLLLLRDPALPQRGLDPSWQLATEFAARNHLVFGRDFIFTYGPYHYLATRLFDRETFGLVLFYDLFAAVSLFWVALRNRSGLALAGLILCLVVPIIQSDGLITLTLFAVFLVCLRERLLTGLVFIALCAPLALAKLSLGLVILPLVLLADAHRALRRKIPVFTAAFLAALLLADIAAGQPLSAVGAFIGNTLEIILGYGRAMQAGGPLVELIWTVGLGGLTAVALSVQALNIWRRRVEAHTEITLVAAVLGLLWVMFVLFKMGFVRQDTHTLIFHQALPGLLVLFVGFLDRPGALSARSKLGLALLFGLVLASSFLWRCYYLRPHPHAPLDLAASAASVVREFKPRLQNGLGWVTGQRWADVSAARQDADKALSRPFPPFVGGAVDAIPWDLAEVIESHVTYRPTPVIQSYSSYTPALQRMDRSYFAGPRAPDTLLLQLKDIDERLPTLALGPSLPVIGQRYDTVGTDGLGLILRKRSAPRAMTVKAMGAASVALERWTPVPAASGLLMAHVTVERTLAGRLVGFLYREPMMQISLRTARGRELRFRFIPDMAQLGVAISPLPVIWEQGAPVLLDPEWASRGEPITALRLSTAHLNWAFKNVHVSYRQVSFEPGFAAQLNNEDRLLPDLAGSDPSYRAALTGDEIFAHAPTVLGVSVLQPIQLSGVAGLRPQPPGSPPGDGVRFAITETTAQGERRTLFDTKVTPGMLPVPFQVSVGGKSFLQLQTDMVANTNYDWSYWGSLKVGK